MFQYDNRTLATLTARAALTTTLIATGIAVIGSAGCGSSGGASAAALCKTKVSCEGGDQKQCEDTLAKQESAFTGACKTTYQDYLSCMTTSGTCTAKTLSTNDPAGCGTKIVAYSQCVASTPIGDGGASSPVDVALFCKALAACDKTTSQAKCEAEAAASRAKETRPEACLKASDAASSCLLPIMTCEKGALVPPPGACKSEIENVIALCPKTDANANP